MDVDFSIEDTKAPSATFVKRSAGPCPFEVSLTTYSMQPWTNKNSNLSQWFNYGLNPSTWSKYSLQQMNLLKTK
jgi:hypothetical protein